MNIIFFMHQCLNVNICNCFVLSDFHEIFTKALDWECYSLFWEIFAHFWMGMGLIFCPKIGLGKSLTALGFEKVSLFQIVRFVQGEQEENF